MVAAVPSTTLYYGPGAREEIIPDATLARAFAWSDGRCQAIQTFVDQGLDLSRLSPPAFDAVAAFGKGTADDMLFRPAVLRELFIEADKLSATPLMQEVVAQTMRLLSDSEYTQLALREVVVPMMAINDQVVNSVDLEPLLFAYANAVVVTDGSFADIVTTALAHDLFRFQRLWYKISCAVVQNPALIARLPQAEQRTLCSHLTPPALRAAATVLPDLVATHREAAAEAALAAASIAAPSYDHWIYHQQPRWASASPGVFTVIDSIGTFFQQQLAAIWAAPNPQKTALERHAEQLAGYDLTHVKAMHLLTRRYGWLFPVHLARAGDVEGALSIVQTWHPADDMTKWATNAIGCLMAQQGDAERAIPLAIKPNDSLWLVFASYVARYDTEQALAFVAERMTTLHDQNVASLVIADRAVQRRDIDACMRALYTIPRVNVWLHDLGSDPRADPFACLLRLQTVFGHYMWRTGPLGCPALDDPCDLMRGIYPLTNRSMPHGS